VTTAVFDSNVVVAGAGWRTESHLCLVALARRRVRVFTSEWILEESRRALQRLQEAGRLAKHDPWPVMNWFADAARLVTPAATGKPRSRDAKDDPILGTALAGHARYLVSQDDDLLALEKPFGIEIVKPRQFLACLHRPI